MQTEEALERVARELCDDSARENIDYLEVRWAPRLHLRRGLSVEQVIQAGLRGLQAGPPSAVAILCAGGQPAPEDNARPANIAGAFAGKGGGGFVSAGQAGG